MNRDKVLEEIAIWLDDKLDNEDEGFTYETHFKVDGFKLKLELDKF